MPDLLTSPQWEPHVATLQSPVYASAFPGKSRTLFLLVNRGRQDVQGADNCANARDRIPAITISGTESSYTPTATPTSPEARTFSVSQLKHAATAPSWRTLATNPQPGFKACSLKRPASRKRLSPASPRNIGSYRNTSSTFLRPLSLQQPPKGWSRFPLPNSASKFPAWRSKAAMHRASMCSIRGKSCPVVTMITRLTIKAFYIDRYPVTHAQFKKFLDASHYRPNDDHNFLKDWVNGSYPAGWANKPVTWVSLEDARAYAAWAGKRLPHEWEWQYAAQGLDGRPYPWGFDANPKAIPKPESGARPRPATDVDAFPQGASPFGVQDLMGNVWQWTDEFVDEHTRAAIVRGGGFYRPSRLDVVLSPQHDARAARQISLDGPVQRPLGDDRLSLRRRRAIITTLSVSTVSLPFLASLYRIFRGTVTKSRALGHSIMARCRPSDGSVVTRRHFRTKARAGMSKRNSPRNATGQIRSGHFQLCRTRIGIRFAFTPAPTGRGGQSRGPLNQRTQPAKADRRRPVRMLWMRTIFESPRSASPQLSASTIPRIKE